MAQNDLTMPSTSNGCLVKAMDLIGGGSLKWPVHAEEWDSLPAEEKRKREELAEKLLDRMGELRRQGL